MAVTLFGIGPALGLADISPFCTKLDLYLRMAEIPFTWQPGSPQGSPKGKLPYLQHGDELLSDSTHIIAYLSRTFPNPLHDPLPPEKEITATLLKSALEEQLYFAALYFRWQHEATWALYQDTIRGLLRKAGVPGLLHGMLVKKLRKRALAGLHAQGTGRHTEAEIVTTNLPIIDATAALLGTQDYIFGSTPHVLDASVFAFVDALLTPPFPSPLQDHIRTHDNLVRYVTQLRTQYYTR